MIESSGAETDIEIGDCFINSNGDKDIANDAKKETIVDEVKEMDIIQVDTNKGHTFSIVDQGGTGSNGGRVKGTTGVGTSIGYRTPTGKRKKPKNLGRAATPNEKGNDVAHAGMHLVEVSARIIAQQSGRNKVVFKAFEDIEKGEMQIVSKGENGKKLNLTVKRVFGEHFDVVDGHIVVNNVKANNRYSFDFEIDGNRRFAMEVQAYGNKK